MSEESNGGSSHSSIGSAGSSWQMQVHPVSSFLGPSLNLSSFIILEK
jgi:hypothetical protein